MESDKKDPLWGYALPIDEKQPFLEDSLPAYDPPASLKPKAFCTCRKRHVCERRFTPRKNLFIATILLTLIALIFIFPYFEGNPTPPTPESITTCAWPHIKPRLSLLSVPPIPRADFLDRQKALASILKKNDIDAFIAEPSASTEYFANISSSFHLSERPFLMIIDMEGGFGYLVPRFERERIAGLEMVYDDGEGKGKKVVEWKEEQDPYQVLKREMGWGKGRVMVDEQTRFMIVSGLQGAGVLVEPVSEEVTGIRAVKSKSEIEILRGINTFTVEVVRGMQKCIAVGVQQEDVFEAAKGLFERAGREVGTDLGRDFWAIVLFGEEAANPHGGGVGKVLKEGEFVLIDIGTNLYGYGSDVTRTFVPKGSSVSEGLVDIWWLVYEAQTKAMEFSRVDETCAVVDRVSRGGIGKAGYGDFYTHRLGHGLGLEGHEHPYLNGANMEKLKEGHVVTNEPGIYVTTEQARKLGTMGDVGFGVRLEDAVLVTPCGGELLTGSRAKSPYEP